MLSIVSLPPLTHQRLFDQCWQVQQKAGAASNAGVEPQVASHGATEAAAKSQTKADARGGMGGFIRRFAEGTEEAARGGSGDSLAMVAHAEHKGLLVGESF